MCWDLFGSYLMCIESICIKNCTLRILLHLACELIASVCGDRDFIDEMVTVDVTACSGSCHSTAMLGIKKSSLLGGLAIYPSTLFIRIQVLVFAKFDYNPLTELFKVLGPLLHPHRPLALTIRTVFEFLLPLLCVQIFE